MLREESFDGVEVWRHRVGEGRLMGERGWEWDKGAEKGTD